MGTVRERGEGGDVMYLRLLALATFILVFVVPFTYYHDRLMG
jgi:hypothetical protein